MKKSFFDGGIWTGGVIGPYYFENDVGQVITVNRKHYRSMNTDFFCPELIFQTRDLKTHENDRDRAIYTFSCG